MWSWGWRQGGVFVTDRCRGRRCASASPWQSGFPALAGGLRQESGVALVTGTLDSLPSDQRTVLANTYRNLSGESAAQLDRTVRTGLSDAGVTSVTRALVFKPISIASTVVSLAALDQVDSQSG